MTTTNPSVPCDLVESSRIVRQQILKGTRVTIEAFSQLLMGMLTLAAIVLVSLQPALASLTNNNYDGNIYSLYAGNGSLVPPRSSLEQALKSHRPSVLVFYLDDDAASKQFAPVVSELQRLWGNSIDLIPLVTDPLQRREATGPNDPATYWHGGIPQVVVIDGNGKILLDAEGAVSPDSINDAISQATGLTLPEGFRNSVTLSINELNSEVVNR